MLFDISVYAGIMLLITVAVDLLKKFGVIQTPEMGGKVAGIIQSVLSIALWAVGTFSPDLLDFMPQVNDFANVLAEFGLGIIALLPIIVKLGNAFHDVFANLPVFSFIAHRVD